MPFPGQKYTEKLQVFCRQSHSRLVDFGVGFFLGKATHVPRTISVLGACIWISHWYIHQHIHASVNISVNMLDITYLHPFHISIRIFFVFTPPSYWTLPEPALCGQVHSFCGHFPGTASSFRGIPRCFMTSPENLWEPPIPFVFFVSVCNIGPFQSDWFREWDWTYSTDSEYSAYSTIQRISAILGIWTEEITMSRSLAQLARLPALGARHFSAWTCSDGDPFGSSAMS